ncbi:Integral membrane protein OS=Streptomyces griseomycini OX=66895 GN=FHS37_004502 PE=4 SV=1 [Streptomyces griseomycini]
MPLVVLQGVTAAGWFRLNGMWPARQGIALGFLGALAADAALLVSDRSTAAILGTLGVWVLLSLVLQLRSHADPDERMYGLMATVAAAALAIAAGGYLAADADAVTVGAVAVAAAAVARALPLPTPASVVVALLVAAGAGFAAGAATGTGASGALLGAGAAVCALIGHRVASYDYPSRFVHFTAGVALPLSAAAPAVYVLGRVFA